MLVVFVNIQKPELPIF